MAITDIYKRLRSYLNPVIKGPFTDAMLNALASGDNINEVNALAAKQQLFIATASGKFLEKLMSNIGVLRPTGIGMSDPLFMKMGVDTTNTKLVTNIFLDVLEIFYGATAVKANVTSGSPQGYDLADGMTLKILVDNNQSPLIITFQTSDFTDITDAKAFEVA